MSDTISNHLRKFPQENFLLEDNVMHNLSDDDNLADKGILDSLGIMELIQHIEEQYGVPFLDCDITLDNLNSIKSITTFIVSRQS